jgi:hypothetical protein
VAITLYVPQRKVVVDRRYGHPFNAPVIAMAIAAWATIALVVLLLA